MPDQSASQSTLYQFRALQGNESGLLLSGVWIPWIWIGDQNAGLEVTTWDVSSQTYNRWTVRPGMTSLPCSRSAAANGHVRWQNYLVRRTRIDAGKGWSRQGSFALAVTPSKKFDPYYSLIKGAHLGPHQHVNKLTLAGRTGDPDTGTERIQPRCRDGQLALRRVCSAEREQSCSARYRSVTGTASRSSPTSRSSISPTPRRNSGSTARNGPSSRPRSSSTTSARGI